VKIFPPSWIFAHVPDLSTVWFLGRETTSEDSEKIRIKYFITKTTKTPLPKPYTVRVYSVSKFIVPDLGDIVDSGIGLSHRHATAASLRSLAGRKDNPMPELTLSPLSGIKNLATGGMGYA
jgi:hypothetical protein